MFSGNGFHNLRGQFETSPVGGSEDVAGFWTFLEGAIAWREALEATQEFKKKLVSGEGLQARRGCLVWREQDHPKEGGCLEVSGRAVGQPASLSEAIKGASWESFRSPRGVE
jgi:hypothetical protein